MKTPEPAKGEAMPETAEDTLTFEPIDIPFNWTNAEWAAYVLPTVRIAIAMCKHTPDEFLKVFQEVENAGAGDELVTCFKNLSAVSEHLEAIVSLLKAAEARALIVAQRHIANGDNA